MNKKLTEKDCAKLFNRITRLIRKSHLNFFRFKKLKGAMGYCYWDQGIVLDHRRELVPTLIHECIHFLEPTWSESRVLYAEKRVVNYINNKQLLKLLKLFIECFD